MKNKTTTLLVADPHGCVLHRLGAPVGERRRCQCRIYRTDDAGRGVDILARRTAGESEENWIARSAAAWTERENEGMQ